MNPPGVFGPALGGGGGGGGGGANGLLETETTPAANGAAGVERVGAAALEVTGWLVLLPAVGETSGDEETLVTACVDEATTCSCNCCLRSC